MTRQLLTLTHEGGGLWKVLTCRNKAASTQVLRAGEACLFQSRALRNGCICAVQTASTSLSGAVTSSNTHGFDWEFFSLF